MKKVQGSPIAKLCAAAVLLAAAFGAGIFGARVLWELPDVTADHWQETGRFYNALEDRRRELTVGTALFFQAALLEERMSMGEAGPTAYADLEAFQRELETLEQRFSRENTWFRFRILYGGDGQVLYSDLEEGETMAGAVRYVSYSTFEAGAGTGSLGEDGSWNIYVDGDGDSLLVQGGSEALYDGEAEGPPPSVQLVLEYGVPEAVDSSIPDEFWIVQETYEENREDFDADLTGLLDLSALSLLAMVFLLWTSGHRNGAEGVVTTWQERIFFDVYAAAAAGLLIFLLFSGRWIAEHIYQASLQSFYRYQDQSFTAMTDVGVGLMCAAFAGAGTLLLRTLVVRLKARCLRRTTLLCRAAGWTVRTVHDFFRSLPFVWKIVVDFLVYAVVTFQISTAGYMDGSGWIMLLYFCIEAAVLLFLARWAYGYHRLRQGTKTIAGGDLDHQIDTAHMPYDLRLQAEDLNNISVGLSTAVDEKMKSERFKAELITNVSHDLKTPLTSIINYVNLLKSTDQTDPKAAEYIEVLDRKSQRLKKLTEDLVEASKASTGVLKVVREKIGMAQLIDQASAEWEEKLNDRKLTLVTTLPEGETWVYADGRHLWRVIDNLLSNCAKYAMEGTRIYLDLGRGKGQVSLSVKNISRDPLNVPAERLMERFVRGEESRTTEGSGLGLSIARSLTELQGGTFELAVDGDLFKAIVTLPQAN